MGVDVVEVARLDAGALHGGAHAAEGAVAVRGRRGDVVGVAREAVADHLGVDLGAARLGVLVLFEHHDPGALAHDEAVAVLVVGAGSPGGVVVEAGGEGAAGGEARERQAVHGGFGAARHHHVGIAELDQPGRVADGVGPGGAGRDHGVVRALEAVSDGDLPGGEIDDAAGNEEGGDPARALVVQGHGGVVDAADAADAGADHHAGGALVLVGRRVPIGVVQGLAGGGHGVDDERIDLALLLGLHEGVGIEAAVRAVAEGHGTRDAAGEIVDGERRHDLGGRLAGDQPAPGGLDPAGQRRHHPQARHHYPTHRTIPNRSCHRTTNGARGRSRPRSRALRPS